jgi:O-antigen/teichoic acid export membrane protein
VGQAAVDLSAYHYQAHLAFVKGGIVNLARSVGLLAAAVTAVILLAWSGEAIALALAIASVTVGTIAAAKIISSTRGQSRISGARLGIGPESVWLTLYSLVATGFATVDVFIVAIILSTNEVATFGAAQRYYAIALGAAPALAVVLRVRTAQQDILDSVDAQVATLRQWMKRVSVPTLALMLLLGLASRPVIPLVDQGRYPTSIPVFQILLIGVFAYYLTLPAVNLLMAQGRYRILAIVFSAAFVINAVGDLLVGPTTGVIGVAVIATVVLAGLSCLVAWLALRAGLALPGRRLVAGRVRRTPRGSMLGSGTRRWAP